MTLKVHEHTLPNGLKLIGEVNSAGKSCVIGFFVKTGSRDETPAESGVSHFLEHMMFKGTPTRSALEITYQMGNYGAQANAFTSEENTVYYAQVIPKQFSPMQDLLMDMLRPALDPQEYDTEKKVILEEIALYEDKPFHLLYQKAFKEYYADHPAGNSVLGTTASVGALARDQMLDYFSRRYSPSNMTFVATGNFSWEIFRRDAERVCGQWKNFPAGRTVKPCPAHAGRKIFRKKGVNQAYVLALAESPAVQSEERYAFSVLASILGDASGSRLYWELVDKGLADSAGTDSDEKDGTGCLMAYASTEPEQAEKVTDILMRVVQSPLEFSAADMERAKTKLLTSLVLSGELPMGRLMSLGMTWNYERKIHSLQETMDRLSAVSVEDIRRAVERFPLQKWGVYTLLPE